MLGTGMGIPSTAIYVHELIHHYEVKTIVRCGTIGAMLPDMELGELVLAISAATDASYNKITFNGQDFAPAADYSLLENAVLICRDRKMPFRVAQVFSTDRFYSEDPTGWSPGSNMEWQEQKWKLQYSIHWEPETKSKHWLSYL
jgi:purine-nucleoside phosphorylase